MSRKTSSPAGHTGRTGGGHTRDVNVERIGSVTIYKRGKVYYLYYRQGGRTHRQKIDGNLAVARTTAHKVGEALAQERPSPLLFTRTAPATLVKEFLDAVTGVQKLALRTWDRYKAALDRFTDFCASAEIKSIDVIDLARVEDFVKWLRGQKRARNGSPNGSRAHYKVGGIKFILSTCRTAFNWAGRRRMLPPYHDNPFKLFPIDKLRDASEETTAGRMFTPEQERAFFAACDPWQFRLFGVLATYGLRVAELTYLLIEDVDLVRETFTLRPKPWLLWNVKTGRERELPLTAETRKIFAEAIGSRVAGFVFMNRAFLAGTKRLPAYRNAAAFREAVKSLLLAFEASHPDASERERKRAIVTYCRSVGQVPERAVRGEFMKLTKEIGCPEFTRVHDLRHMFSSRAQAAGVNPILVQDMLGHTTLDMTRRYTHLGMETKRAALHSVLQLNEIQRTSEPNNEINHAAKETEAK
jgi:integrase